MDHSTFFFIFFLAILHIFFYHLNIFLSNENFYYLNILKISVDTDNSVVMARGKARRIGDGGGGGQRWGMGTSVIVPTRKIKLKIKIKNFKFILSNKSFDKRNTNYFLQKYHFSSPLVSGRRLSICEMRNDLLLSIWTLRWEEQKRTSLKFWHHYLVTHLASLYN